MLSRVLELWDQVPGRRAADRHQPAGGTRNGDRGSPSCAGEFDRGITFAKAALDETDPAAEPVRAALLLEARGHPRSTQLGRADYAADLQEAARLVPAEPADALPGPGFCEALAHDIHHRPGGWDEAEFQARPKRPWPWPAGR